MAHSLVESSDVHRPRTIAFVPHVALAIQRHHVLALVLAVALACYVYARRRRGLMDQLSLYRALRRSVTTAASGPSTKCVSPTLVPAPVEEWHIVTEHGTQMQSLVYYPLERREPKTLVVIVPGNPGVSFFYLPLMQELVRRHGRRHEVRCLSHAGHFLPSRNKDQAFTLQEQLAHKAAYVQQRLQAEPTLQLVLIGHSIGSYVVLDMARRFRHHIAKLVFMQPTIMHMALSRKGKQMMPLFHHYERAVALVAAVEYLVPLSLRQWIVRRVVGGDTSELLQLASLSLVHASVMRNVLKMAANEMEEVTELDGDLLAKVEQKVLFVYSPVDEWVPAEFVQEYQLRFPNAQHRVVPQAHAFMMEANGTHDMAAHISHWIAEVLDGKQPSEMDAVVA